MAGLSLGGGGVFTCIADSAINHQIAGAIVSCPGYITSPTDNILGTGTNSATYSITDAEYAMIARSGLPIWICHAVNDDQASIDRSDTFIEKVNSHQPLFPPKYFRFNSGNHGIWSRLYQPSTFGAGYGTTSNGTVRFGATVSGVDCLSIYEWLLQFSTERPRKPVSE